MSEKTKNVRYALVGMLLLFCSAVMQAQTVSGNVKDATGEPIIGATVMEQGTQNGTVTDFDGNFSINLKGKSNKLVISYVGMENKTVDVAGKSSVNVSMKDDAQMLDEVVAIGYTTVRKRDLTGAVSQVSAKQIEDIPVTNVTEALTGKMAGVNITTTEGSPDAEISIRVRGGGSISQDNSPLYIVDGFEVSSINDIASSDIETIDVLKDAASTAIYGARGANGVVIITTKSGKEGKVNITLNATYGWEKVKKEIGVLDPYNFALYQYETVSHSQINGPELGSYGTYSELEQWKGYQGNNWQDMLFGRTGTQKTYDISVNGGTKKFKYNVSYAHVGKDAIMLNSGLKRDNVMAKLSYKFNKWLSADFKFSLSNQKVEGLSSGEDTNESNATNSWSNKAIRFAPVNKISDDGAPSEEDAGTRVNPYRSVMGTDKVAKQLKHSYNFGLTWKPWKGWKFNTRFSMGWNNKDTDQAWLGEVNNNSSKFPDAGQGLVDLQTDHRKTLSNTNTVSYDAKNFLLPGDKFTALLGQEWKQTKQTKTENVYTGLDKDLYNTFDLLYSNTDKGRAIDPWTFVYPNDRMTSFFGQVLYTIKDKYYLNATLRADGSSKFGSGNRWGWFPAVQLAWRISEEEFMKKYEWISNLKLRLSIGTAGNNRIDSGLLATLYEWSKPSSTAPYFTDPVTGEETRASYLMHGEYLYNPDLKWETTITRNIGIDYGFWKGRVNGSFDVYWNSTNDLLMKARIPRSSGYLYQIQNFGSTANKGFELSTNVVIIDNKSFSLNGNFNISYNRNKITELNTDDKWQSSGFAGSTIADQNDFYIEEGGRLGEIWGYKYNGFYTADELSLSPSGEWKDKTTVEVDGQIKDANYTYGSSTIYPGAPKYVDKNGDGKIDENDKYRLGNTVPTWTGGFGFDATWKNTWGTIDASIFFNFSLGNQILNGTRLCNSFYAGSSRDWNLISDFNIDNRYTGVDPATGMNIAIPGTNGKIISYYGGTEAIIQRLNEINAGKTIWNPRSVTNMPINDWAIEDADFLRLQSVTIGYSLPKAWLKKIHLQKVRIYFTGRNLACITGYSGYDPEVSVSKNAMCPGIDFATYPKSRSYTMGLNLQF